MSESERYTRVISAIKSVAKQTLPEGSQVRLYGSRARGSARPDSDWDIHILIPGPDKLPFATMRGYCNPIEILGWDMDEEINTLIHTYKGWERRWFLPLYRNIETDKIIIYDSSIR